MKSESRVTPASERASRPLDAVLRARSVAIIGASADPTKRGHQIIRALQRAGYDGAIHPVHPRGGELLGLRVSPAVSAIDPPPELAVLCTPAASVPDVLAECAQHGVRAAVILALGFREAGAAGAALESRVRDVVVQHGIRVIGPNTSGIINVPLGLNLIGIREVPRGRLALIVQSGNLLLEQVTQAQRDGGEGFGMCIGLGNMVDVTWADVLTDLAADDDIGALVMYAEGFADGRAFVDAAARAARRKPLALLRGGVSAAGESAARSHTGALATSAAVLHAALHAAGVIEVERTDELRAVATTLAWQPAVQGGVAILSDGGGHATLAADVLGRRGVTLAQLSPQTMLALRSLLGAAAAVGNPIDVAGATDRSTLVFADALRLLLADDAVGAVLLVGLFGGYALRFAAELAQEEVATAHALAELTRASGRAFVVHSLYHAAGSEALAVLRAAEVPVLGSLEQACAALSALVERGAAAARPPQAALPQPRRGGAAIIVDALRNGRSALLETETRALAERYGVACVPAMFCRDAVQAADAARQSDGPVAVRLVSATLLHKTEVGGVQLNVAPGDVAPVFDEILAAAERWGRAHDIDAAVHGVLVSPMLPPPVAELLLGARRDPCFGPVLSVGIGGTAAEAIGDVALRLLPTTAAELRAAFDTLRAAPLLRGWRGASAVALDDVIELGLRLGDCLLDNPELSDIEANPVFAYDDRALAVDVRALLSVRA